MKILSTPKAFTLMEIMIVVIIMGIMAAFAIPNYGKSVAQTYLQDAIIQLSAIRTANQVYFARTSSYWPNSGETHGVDEINTALSLNLIENGLKYNCAAGAPATYSCTATRLGTSTFTVTITQAALSDTNPACTAGSCP